MTKTSSSNISFSIYIVMLMLLGLTALSCGESDDQDQPLSAFSADTNHPYGLYAPGTFEATSPENERLIFSQLGLSSLEQFQDFTLGLIDELGITWVRIDFYYIDSSFVEYPAYLQQLYDRDINVVGCIRPAFPLNDEQLVEFKADLKQLIADHPDILVWQLDNEPDLEKYDPDEYTEVFLAMEPVVRENCPSCRIALAGAAVPFDGGIRDRVYYDQVMAGIAARTSEPSPFDIVDLHLYGRTGNYLTIPGLMKDYRQILTRNGYDEATSIWFTECATYTGRPSLPPNYPAQTEEEQAAELLKRFATAAAEGAEMISWNRFYENYQYGTSNNGYFDNTGLVYNGLGAEAESGIAAGTRKQAFFAYETLIKKTGGYSQVTRLAPGQFRYDFPDGQPPVYMVWAENGTTLPAELEQRVVVTDYTGNKSETDVLSPLDMPVFVETA